MARFILTATAAAIARYIIYGLRLILLMLGQTRNAPQMRSLNGKAKRALRPHANDTRIRIFSHLAHFNSPR